MWGNSYLDFCDPLAVEVYVFDVPLRCLLLLKNVLHTIYLNLALSMNRSTCNNGNSKISYYLSRLVKTPPVLL